MHPLVLPAGGTAGERAVMTDVEVHTDGADSPGRLW
jgi:hypothetical protein